MERKIVFFDIDGTLLSEITKEIPVSAINAIHKMQENGHVAVINTGRTWTLLEKKIQDIGFDAYICGCGTKIWYQGKTLFHQTVEDEMAKKIIAALKKYKIDGILEGDKKLYMDKRENIIRDDWREFGDNFKEISEYWGSPELSMDKLYTRINAESDLEGFQKELSEQFVFIDRENDFEIVPKNCTKATGIQKLIDYLNIPLENTISIGDSNNDLSMLDYTAVSIAMGTHSEGIHDRVDYITKTVEEDGIYHALSHYGLI